MYSLSSSRFALVPFEALVSADPSVLVVKVGVQRRFPGIVWERPWIVVLRLE